MFHTFNLENALVKALPKDIFFVIKNDDPLSMLMHMQDHAVEECVKAATAGLSNLI